MKHVIHNLYEDSFLFSCVIDNKCEYFYLTKAQAKKYIPFLDKGSIVDFELYNKRKKVDGVYAWQIAYFNQIEKPSYLRNHMLYDLHEIRKSIHTVLKNFDYLLFIDMEMTMPPYHKGPFEAEIIQVGYVLKDPNGSIIETDSFYIKPTKYPKVSPRTEKFLKLTNEYYDNARDYSYFYSRLRDMIEVYHPKLVVWGRNDLLALKASYEINQVEPLTDHNSFVNLLQIHKNYYNLTDDLGLFKAYELYYKEAYIQMHDALDDAKVTAYVYEALLSKMKEAY